MRILLTLFSLLGCIYPLISATALTYKLQPNEKACFFSFADKQGLKLAFYFAVQSGGSFDVDYSVVGPNEKTIMEGTKERQGDFVFTAKEQGEYRFCFNNEMSTFAEKMVDFEIAVENESRDAQLPSKQGTSPEQTSALEESILKVSRDLSTINRNQKYFRTRENRNMSTVKSTESRIFNFSVAESALMVSMAGLQVFIVRFFFQGARKGRRPIFVQHRELPGTPCPLPPALNATDRFTCQQENRFIDHSTGRGLTEEDCRRLVDRTVTLFPVDIRHTFRVHIREDNQSTRLRYTDRERSNGNYHSTGTESSAVVCCS
ncbi:MAG: hypothetical protein Q9170_007526 [Blastenia crenularia]